MSGNQQRSIARPITIIRNFHHVHQVIGEIYFPTSDDTLDIHDKAILEVICLNLRGLSLRVGCFANILVIGGADHRGGSQFNVDLGRRRADSVTKFIEARGFFGTRFQSRSAGEERAKQPTTLRAVAKDRLAADRRVDIVLSLTVDWQRIRKLEIRKKKIQSLLKPYQGDMIDKLGVLAIYAPGDYTINSVKTAANWVKPKGNSVTDAAVAAVFKAPLAAIYIMASTPSLLLTDGVVSLAELGRRKIGDSSPRLDWRTAYDQASLRLELDEVLREIHALSTCQVRVRR